MSAAFNFKAISTVFFYSNSRSEIAQTTINYASGTYHRLRLAKFSIFAAILSMERAKIWRQMILSSRYDLEDAKTWCCSSLLEGAKSKKRSAEVALSKSKPKKAKAVKDGKRKKAKGDGPQVKRASSAYIHFTTDFRKKLKEKCEKKGDSLPKANEVAKMAGEAWKNLTDEEKKPYNILAQEDKERYLKEVSKHNRQNKAQV